MFNSNLVIITILESLIKIAEFLIRKGADINFSVDEYGHTPLMIGNLFSINFKYFYASLIK
jgi:ankyrin repeat protein